MTKSKIPNIAKTISFPVDLFIHAEENNIKLTDAIETGIKIKLADLDIIDYDENLILFQKLQNIRKLLELTNNEKQILEETLKKYQSNETTEEKKEDDPAKSDNTA